MINKFKNEIIQSKTFLSFSFLKILGQGVTFLLPLIVAKILSPDVFGSYSLSMMIAFFFSSVFISSAQTPFIVYANEEFEKNNKINKAFSVQLLFLLSSIVFFITMAFFLSSYITSFANISNLQLMFLFLAYLGIGLNSFIENLFLAIDKRINHSLYFLVVGIVSLALLLLFYFQNNLNLNRIFLIYFISSIITTFIFLHKIDFKILFPFIIDRKIFSEMFHWTKWQIMGLTAVYFINWGDNLVLRYFVSMEEIGTYNLGYQIFKGLITLTFVLNSYFLPFVNQNIDNKEKIGNYLNVKAPKIVLIGTLGILLIYITIPFVFSFIYGDAYSESVTILRILLICIPFRIYDILSLPIFNSMRKYRYLQFINVVQVLLNIFLDIILVSFFGFTGAAIATTVSYIARSVVNFIYFKKIKVKFCS